MSLKKKMTLNPIEKWRRYISTCIFVYIYIYKYICVCLCVLTEGSRGYSKINWLEEGYDIEKWRWVLLASVCIYVYVCEYICECGSLTGLVGHEMPLYLICTCEWIRIHVCIHIHIYIYIYINMNMKVVFCRYVVKLYTYGLFITWSWFVLPPGIS